MFDALTEALRRFERHPLTRPKRAAILVPILDDGGPPRLVLTRRTAELNTHQGQVAFPGGRLDPGESIREAALREAWEEVGLAVGAVDVLGELDDIPTVHNDTVVTPVVGRVRGTPELKANPTEVARIFEVPLEALARRSGWRMQRADWQGRSYPIYYFDWEGETLWGLSAYVTLQLLEFTEYGSPHPIVREESFR